MITTLRKMRDRVESREKFKGNSVFAEWVSPSVYVVYSYGYHFPMFACINGAWHGNSDKYSRTTSRHQSECRPNVSEIVMMDTEGLKALIEAVR